VPLSRSILTPNNFYSVLYESFPLHPLFFPNLQYIALKREEYQKKFLVKFTFLQFLVFHHYTRSSRKHLAEPAKHRHRRSCGVKGKFKLHQVTRAIHFD
jgi:hypothetical protein